MLSKIKVTICKEAESFAKEKGVGFTDKQLIYRNKIIGHSVKLDMDSFYISLNYRVRNSTLYCAFEPKNEPLGIEYLFYDICVNADIHDFRPTVFAYVTGPEDAETALDIIFNVLRDHLPEIRFVFDSPEQVRALRLEKTDEMKNQLGCDIFETASEFDDSFIREDYLLNALELYGNIELSRYCSQRYSDFLDGKYKKALKGYKGKKYNSNYENRICAFLESSPAPQVYANFIRNAKSARSGIREFLPLVLSWILLTFPLTVLYGAMYYMFVFFFEKGAVYNTAIELYNCANCFLPAFITSVSVSYFFRRGIIRLFGKNKEKQLAYDKIFNTKGMVRFMQYFAITVVGVSVIFTMLFANDNLSFYDEKIVDNSGLFELYGTEHRYSDITEAYECEGVTNSFGQWMEGRHLIVRFKDGTEINTYFYADYGNIEKSVYPILKENGVEIKKVKELK